MNIGLLVSIAVAFVVLTFFIITFTTARSIYWLNKPSGLFHPVDRIDDSAFLDDVDRVDEWAFANGFEFASYYHFQWQRGQTANLAGWYNPDTKAGLVLTHIQIFVVLEFATYYNDGTEINTSDHGDALLLPPAPEVHTEAFPGVSLDELHRRHCESQQFVEERFGCSPISQDILLSLEESTYHHTNYIRSLPFWWLRSGYWYFVRRIVLRNKSIAAQLGEPDWRPDPAKDQRRLPNDSRPRPDEGFRPDESKRFR